MKKYNDLIKVLEDGPISYEEDKKVQFKRKSTLFLKALAQELDLIEFKVGFNPGGVAVSGDATLIGMWDEENGVYVSVTDDFFMYRAVSHIKDYSGKNSRNNFIFTSWNRNLTIPYDEVLSRIKSIKK